MSGAAKAPRGFASMEPGRRRALGREGGYKAAKMGVGHKFNSETARAAVLKRNAAK